MDQCKTTPFTCLHCGKASEVKTSQFKAYKGAGKFCSRECHYAYKRAHPEEYHNWKGGKSVDDAGYIRQKDPETQRETREHRLVVEQVVGRKLESWEHVHHINGDKADNRPENLEILTVAEHAAHHQQEYRKQYWEPVRRLYGEGKSARAIAAELKINRRMVARIFGDLGLEPRPQGRQPKQGYADDHYDRLQEEGRRCSKVLPRREVAS